jgi:predicted secreted protein
MAIEGHVGAVYAPDDLTGTNVPSETFSGDDSTVEFTHANEYVIPYSETVEVDSTEQTRNKDYTINYITGKITFESAPASGTDNISVDYDYYTISEVGGFFSWTINKNADTLESTSFDSSGERTYVAGLTDWDGSASKYWASDKTFHDFVGEDDIIIVFYVDDVTNNYRYEGYGVVNSKSVDTSVDSLIEESIDIQGSGTLTYRSS